MLGTPMHSGGGATKPDGETMSDTADTPGTPHATDGPPDPASSGSPASSANPASSASPATPPPPPSGGPSCPVPPRGLGDKLLCAALPFVESLRGYSMQALRADMLAALTVAVVALPQSMAYAVIAGVHPRYGLYAAIVPVIVAALWGASRYLIAGPTNAIAMLLFATVAETVVNGVPLSALPEETRMAYVFGVAILAGLLQVVMGLARLGELVHFISHSVMVGFTAGAAVLIAVGQLKNLLGVSIGNAPTFVELVLSTVRHLPQTNPWALGTGLFAMAVALGIARVHRRLPAAFLAVAASGVAAWALDLGAHGVKVVGAIPAGLPPFSLPPAPDAQVMRDLFMPALAIALLGVVEALSIAKTLAGARGEQVDGSREFVAQGLANISAGFFSGIPGSGSFTRSAVNFVAGARTRFAGALSGVITLLAVLLLAPLAAFIPIAALAGILMIIAWGMIDKHGIALALKATRADRTVLLATFAATLLLDLEKAVFVGVLLSLVLFLRKVSHPLVSRMDTCDSPELQGLPAGPCCPNLAVYSIEGTLFFGAVDELEQRLYEYEDFGHRAVILHLRQVHWVDATGVHAFQQFLRKCQRRGVALVLSGVKPAVRAVFERSGLVPQLGADNMAETLSDALALCYRRYLKGAVCDACKSSNEGRCRRDHHAGGSEGNAGTGGTGTGAEDAAVPAVISGTDAMADAGTDAGRSGGGAQA